MMEKEQNKIIDAIYNLSLVIQHQEQEIIIELREYIQWLENEVRELKSVKEDNEEKMNILYKV